MPTSTRKACSNFTGPCGQVFCPPPLLHSRRKRGGSYPPLRYRNGPFCRGRWKRMTNGHPYGTIPVLRCRGSHWLSEIPMSVPGTSGAPTNFSLCLHGNRVAITSNSVQLFLFTAFTNDFAISIKISNCSSGRELHTLARTTFLSSSLLPNKI